MNLFRGVWGHMAPKAGLGLKSAKSVDNFGSYG